MTIVNDKFSQPSCAYSLFRSNYSDSDKLWFISSDNQNLLCEFS